MVQAGEADFIQVAVSEHAIDLEVLREEVRSFERRLSEIEGHTRRTQEP